MPPLSRSDLLRQRKYETVLTAIGTLGEFTEKELKEQCHETSATFVSSVISQLTRDGLIENLPAQGRQKRLSFRAPETFVPETWIRRQIVGDQVTQQPKDERPRERLIEQGAASLRTGELLAVLIRSGRKGESAVQAGQRLANHFGDRLDQLRKCSRNELRDISTAVSEVAYCQIMAGIELGRRVSEAMERNLPTEKINSTRAAIDYCMHHFSRLAVDGCQEEFHIVTLDTKLQPISRHKITVGTLDASLVHPREVFRPAIRDAAASVILVHNHPSGDPTPSREDRAVTDRLKKAGEIIGIGVLDHIVVGRNAAASLAES